MRFEEQNGSSLSDFLASAALISSNDEEEIEGSVKLMTIHAAKGLEFRLVFLTGLEEGLFPLGNEEGDANIEEERRLCYVGVTRAMEILYITRARNRLRGGRHNQSPESRFLGELQFGRSFKFNKGSTKNTLTNLEIMQTILKILPILKRKSIMMTIVHLFPHHQKYIIQFLVKG